MNIVILIITILLILCILWPPFTIFVLFLAGIILVIYYKHTRGIPSPLWQWGENPHNSVVIKWWNKKPQNVELIYWKEGPLSDWNHLWQTHWEGEKNKEKPIKQQNNKKDIPKITIEDCFKEIFNNSEKLKGYFREKEVSPSTRHIFILNQLEAGVVYGYKIVNKVTGKPIRFRKKTLFYTQPPIDPNRKGSKKYSKIVFFGDMQQQERLALVETYLIKRIKKEKPAALVYMGDHVHNYSRHDLWYSYFRIMRLVFPYIPYYPTIGNHCGGEDNGFTAGRFYLLEPQNSKEWIYTWYFDKIYFISLNTLPIMEEKWEKVEIIEEKLKHFIQTKPSHCKGIIVYMHTPWIGPPYRSDGVVSRYEKYLEENWKPLFEREEIKLVFSGHKHSYVREGKYIVTASMHGIRSYPEKNERDSIVKNAHHYVSLYIYDDSLIVKAIDWKGKIFDEYKVLLTQN